jgi:hypothetical protein
MRDEKGLFQRDVKRIRRLQHREAEKETNQE